MPQIAKNETYILNSCYVIKVLLSHAKPRKKEWVLGIKKNTLYCINEQDKQDIE